jgi:hypothetical protein
MSAAPSRLIPGMDSECPNVLSIWVALFFSIVQSRVVTVGLRLPFDALVDSPSPMELGCQTSTGTKAGSVLAKRKSAITTHLARSSGLP